MKNLFLLLVICPLYFLSQKLPSDTLYSGTNLKLLEESLVYSELFNNKCNTSGNYVSGINENDLLTINGVYKCEHKYSTGKYFLSVNFGDKVGYVEANSDKFIVFNKQRKTISEFHDVFQKMSDVEKDTLRSNSLRLSIAKLEEKKSKLFEYLNTFDKYGIAIIKANAVENYSMTDASFKILNTSKKTIKYITFNFYGLNAVDDKVGTTKIKKGIGPVERYAKGAWEFEAVWLTDIVEYLKLTSIQIQYMDGKTKIIPYSRDLWIDEDKLYELESIL